MTHLVLLLEQMDAVLDRPVAEMYVVACNRIGTTDDTTFLGHSCIIDPWGEIVVEADDMSQLLTAAIDLGKVSAVRTKIPIFVVSKAAT
jgi:predicted amidohydrolase